MKPTQSFRSSIEIKSTFGLGLTVLAQRIELSRRRQISIG
jgi:hypothetical protein